MSEINLIIIPGWGGDSGSWQKFVNAVAPDFNNIRVIDLPCFGSEPCPAEIWGVKEYSDFVERRIEEFNLPGKLALLGHSFGGQIAVNLVANNPELIDFLILSGATVFRPKKIIRRLFLGVAAKAGKIIFKLPIIKKYQLTVKKIFYKVIKSDGYAGERDIKGEIFKKIVRQDLRGVLKNIQPSTLIIWGEKDKHVPLRYGKAIYKQMPKAALHIVKGGRHGLHINKIEELRSALLNFLYHDKQH